MFIKYKEIKEVKYNKLTDKHGAYVVCNKSFRRWVLNNKLHRIDGPAVTWGKKPQSHYSEYWKYGKKYLTKEEFLDSLTVDEVALFMGNPDNF